MYAARRLTIEPHLASAKQAMKKELLRLLADDQTKYCKSSAAERVSKHRSVILFGCAAKGEYSCPFKLILC